MTDADMIRALDLCIDRVLRQHSDDHDRYLRVALNELFPKED